MKNSITEIRSIFMKNMDYTVVEHITPNPEQSRNCFQLENSNGGLMLDHSNSLTMVATAFCINDLVDIYNNEVYNNKLEFYKD